MEYDYKWAGVDVTAGYKAVELIKKFVDTTKRPEVVSGLGGFGGMFSIAAAKTMEEPILVSGTDGVGTKIKLAFELDIHDTVGIDCVAMCVNDIICCGASPLFFLDYIACDKNIPEKIAQIVKGVSEGCVMAGCSLIGGETAEMSGIYGENEYDLAGFAVGIVDGKKALDGSKVEEGDVILGLASSGLHSNGFSLVRKLIVENNVSLHDFVPELDAKLSDIILTPTKIFVKPIMGLLEQVDVHAIANITGGGFYENIPRMFSTEKKAVIYKKAIRTPKIFTYLQKLGNLSEKTLFNAFNMGVGMTVCVSPKDVDKAIGILENFGETAYVIGEVAEGCGVEIC